MNSSPVRVQRMPVSSGTSHLYSTKYQSSYNSSRTRPLPPGGYGPYDENGRKLRSLGTMPSTYKPRTTSLGIGPLTPAKSDYGKSYSGLSYPYATSSTISSRYIPSSSMYTSTTTGRNDRRSSITEYRNTTTVSPSYGTIPRKSSYESSSSSLLQRQRSSSLFDLSNSSDSAPPMPYSSKKSYENGHSSTMGNDRTRTSVRTTSYDVDRLSRTLNRSTDLRTESTSRARRSSRESSSNDQEASTSSMSEREESDRSLKVQSHQSSDSSFGTGSKYDGGKTGLSNLGNTCFMNSVIQCLSNTRPLLDYCLENDYQSDLNAKHSSMRGALIKAFSKLLLSLWKGNDTHVTPHSFKTEIQRFAPRFMGYQQQDSQEFLRYLLEGLHEDVNRVRDKPKPITLKDEMLENKTDEQKASLYWETYLRFDNSKIVEIFVGQLKSELMFDCGHTSVTFDPFWDLSLPLPKIRSQTSLQDCLKLFMRKEKLDDEERPTCYKCKKRRSCSKGFSIQKFPKILVLHLKRFSQERYSRKVTTSVDFPTRDLDLTEFASDREHSKIVYNLYAVSNHSGGTHSGHYTAICKHPYREEWHLYNDTRVTPVRSNQAVSSEGYLLFYELNNASTTLNSF